jgi:hypothetical protein
VYVFFFLLAKKNDCGKKKKDRIFFTVGNELEGDM